MLKHLLATALACGTAFAPSARAADDPGWFPKLELHGQATTVLQGTPSFAAAYSGQRSLRSGGQLKETTSATLFVGGTFWPGGELYINPELFQGLGLSGTSGIAGFPNGEASKSGGKIPRPNLSRYFLRQTFGFGGPQETVESGPNQVAATYDVSRLTITVGKYSGSDMFDDNLFAHDPRTQFMNWSIWDSGAWDFAADSKGYTRGITIDLNQEKWALRYGAHMPPSELNGDELPFRGTRSLSHLLELELRQSLVAGQDGALRLLGFLTRGRMGRFRDSLALGGNPDDAIETTRQYGNRKIGFAINGEQALTDDLGAFLRLSWNDGKTEDLSFTQIDRSIAAGISLKGTRWQRPEDTVGLAVAMNGLSREHREFLAAGGVGLIIGDGRLNYAPEKLMETYYSWQVAAGFALTVDYQFILDPAYNRDRGPVHVLTGRLHTQF